MADHVARKGCKSIHFLARPFSAPSVNMRIAGYREALRAWNLPFDESNIHVGDPLDDLTVQTILSRNPQAILCANDSTAAKLMQALMKNKIDVPSQIMVTGVDDIAYSRYLTPTLTTYRQPCEEIAAMAVKILIDRIEKDSLPPRTTQLIGELVERESTNGTH
jgi:LacI family transcriptional regulator